MTTETTAQAWRRRVELDGPVDFTMMYVAHDAFRRDLARLAQAIDAGRPLDIDTRATWSMFNRQLHIHHETEDASLWPRLRNGQIGLADLDLLTTMRAEHRRLDPLLRHVDASFARDEPDGPALHELRTVLDEHMRHEETEALPLIARTIGPEGWAGFSRDIREAVGGMRAGAAYLPWVLDGAPEPARRAVLKVLPPPARLLCRLRWEPRYARSPHLR
ncbi:MAG TPA: hemerythrin domain-containing protein [Jatrophihabitans sp.]|nr:hemerythrin domain-containing protein [Jatrophihabitans sp.]